MVGSAYLAGPSFELESGFHQVDLPAGTSDRLPDGSYEVRLYGAEDEILYQRSFGLFEGSKADTTSEGSVVLALPAVEGLQEIAFLFQGTQIGSITPSANPPEVQLLTPAPGESWGEGGQQRIAWEASDADGDILTFNVQYSQDGGETWRSLAPRVQGATSIEVDSSSFPGGATQFRVLASDGFHSTSSEGEGAIEVSRKAPQIHLALPEDGFTYSAGEAVVFRGFAADMEDQPLADSSFAWNSNLDGALGAGRTLWGLDLTPGEHEITLTVTDSDGMTASESVQIEVLSREAVMAGEASPGMQVPPLSALLIITGLGLLGLAGLGTIILALRGDF